MRENMELIFFGIECEGNRVLPIKVSDDGSTSIKEAI